MNFYNNVEYMTKLGKYLGYPECCISSFIETIGAIGNPLGAEAGQMTGFIPCPKCAERVLNGEIKLEELIQNRHHNEPFPVKHLPIEIDPEYENN